MPQPDQLSDVIKITGQVTNVDQAKLGLLERVKELQAEQADRVRTRPDQIKPDLTTAD